MYTHTTLSNTHSGGVAGDESGVGWGDDIHFVGDEAAMIQCENI